jgi:hypothetical protein
MEESSSGSRGKQPPAVRGWPPWARRVVSAVILFHIAAVLAAALAAPPSSPFELRIAEQFRHYHELVNQQSSYRFYAPEPPPTPVVEAILHFSDGRPDQKIRIPDRSTRPRLRYQRQLALANWLWAEYAEVRNAPAEANVHSHWAPSYARHLGQAYGCSSVTLYVKQHLIPDPERLRSEHLHIDAEEFETVPDRIGDFPCGA